MPNKKAYLVRTWSVPGERDSVVVRYRTATNMAKRVKMNAERTGDNHPSAKRMKREVKAVDDWIKVMRSKDWLSSQYIVGPIRTPTRGKRDDSAQTNVDNGGANDQPFHHEFGYDDYQCDENAPANTNRGDLDTRDGKHGGIPIS